MAISDGERARIERLRRDLEAQLRHAWPEIRSVLRAAKSIRPPTPQQALDLVLHQIEVNDRTNRKRQLRKNREVAAEERRQALAKDVADLQTKHPDWKIPTVARAILRKQGRLDGGSNAERKAILALARRIRYLKSSHS